MTETEIWKSLDFLGYPDYEVSTLGNVKSLNYRRSGKEKILKQGKDKDKYIQVVLCSNRKHKTFKVHRLVAMAFIPNSENLPCINHKDENKENNKVDNLEWVTVKQNNNYGTRNKRMSEIKKIPILQYTLNGEFIKEWDSIKQAQQELNLSHICNCCKGKRNKCGGFIWRYKE